MYFCVCIRVCAVSMYIVNVKEKKGKRSLRMARVRRNGVHADEPPVKGR